MTDIIDKRYLLKEKLGEGGMGVVNRAVDRLTGQTVALKSVKAPTRELMFNSKTDDSTNLRLAREFQTLASLRHPRIISVLDYGFDATIARTGEHLWEPEVFRLRAELRLAEGASTEQAESLYQKAISLARQRHARVLELRAAMSLSRLWQQQAKSEQAHALLLPVYNGFSEGFATPDLVEAKALLEALT